MLTMFPASAGARVFSSIDDLLGPQASRYFGKGFKRVRRVLSDCRFDPATRTLTANARIAYPESWSQKGSNRTLTPHLSTLDALFLQSYLSEMLLAAYFDFGDAPHIPVNFRRLEIKAGSVPSEDLAQVPIRVVVGPSERTLNGFARFSTVISATIGTMAVSAEVEHAGLAREQPLLPAMNCCDEPQLPFARECRMSMAEDRSQQLADVRFDASGRNVQADWAIQGGSGHPPFITPIEVVAALAQLAQALIYKIDRLERAQSDTLWMRHILLENIGHHRPTGKCLAEVWLDSDKSVRLGGQGWRLFRVLGQLGTSRAACMLAHRLAPSLANSAASVA